MGVSTWDGLYRYAKMDAECRQQQLQNEQFDRLLSREWALLQSDMNRVTAIWAEPGEWLAYHATPGLPPPQVVAATAWRCAYCAGLQPAQNYRCGGCGAPR